MIKHIQPIEKVEATLTLPGSKSYTHRALIAAALATGESILANALRSEDTELTARALASLGARPRLAGPHREGPGHRWAPAAGD